MKHFRAVAKLPDMYLGDMITSMYAENPAAAAAAADFQKKNPLLKHLGVFEIKYDSNCDTYMYRGFEITEVHDSSKTFGSIRGMFEYRYNVVDCRYSEHVYCGYTYGNIHDVALCIDRIAEGLSSYLIRS